MTSQLVKVELTKQSSTQLFPLGALHITETGQHYRYMKADGAATVNLLYTYDDGWEVEEPLTTTVAASGEIHPLCVPAVTMTDDYFAWCFVGPGQVTLQAGSSLAIAAQKAIYTCATGGMVEDNSSSTVLIPGLVAYTAITTNSTGTFIANVGLYVSN